MASSDHTPPEHPREDSAADERDQQAGPASADQPSAHDSGEANDSVPQPPVADSAGSPATSPDADGFPDSNPDDSHDLAVSETDTGASSAAEFDLEEEFRKLAAELDDIPGFRNLQPMPSDISSAPASGGPPPSGPRDWQPGPEDPTDGDFVPPDPELRLDGDPARILGWVLVILGTAVVIVAVIFSRVLPSITLPIGMGMGLIGALLLIWRLPKDRDDEWDNGARV